MNSNILKDMETSLQTTIAENKQNCTKIKKLEDIIAKHEQTVSFNFLIFLLISKKIFPTRYA